MKFNSDYQALAHHWVHHRDNSECYGDRMYSLGDKMYSYGHHYIIAQFVKDKQKNEVVLFNAHKSSTTTDKQRNIVLAAIPSYQTVFTVPDAKLNHDINIRNYFDEIEEFLNKASRARTLKEEHLESAEEWRKELKLYFESFKTGYRLNKEQKVIMNTPITNDSSTADTLAALQDSTIKRRKAAKAKQRKLNKIAYQKQLEQVEEWKKGNRPHVYAPLCEVALRVKNGSIETSQSAYVSELSGMLLYKALKSGKKINGTNIDTYTAVSHNESEIVIGCHHIPMTEVKRIAKEQNW